MYVNSRKDRPAGSFRCANKAVPDRQCPGVTISRPAVEGYMEDVILGAIGGLLEYRVVERIEGADTGEIDIVAQEIADLQAAIADDGADYAVLLPRLDTMKERRRSLLERPGRTVRTRVATGRTLADAWADGGVQERQYMLSDMLDSVRVHKARKTGVGSPAADRLEPVWIDLPSDDD
jgi:site-specific DNA recombinase